MNVTTPSDGAPTDKPTKAAQGPLEANPAKRHPENALGGQNPGPKRRGRSRKAPDAESIDPFPASEETAHVVDDPQSTSSVPRVTRSASRALVGSLDKDEAAQAAAGAASGAAQHHQIQPTRHSPVVDEGELPYPQAHGSPETTATAREAIMLDLLAALGSDDDPMTLQDRVMASKKTFEAVSRHSTEVSSLRPILNTLFDKILKGSDRTKRLRDWRFSVTHNDWAVTHFFPMELDINYLRGFHRLTGLVSTLAYDGCKQDISHELATSEASKIFDKVSPHVSEFLVNPETSKFVLEAGVWDYLISTVFNKPSGIWGGRHGRAWEELCQLTCPITPREFLASPPAAQEFGAYHDIRARFSTLIGKVLATAPGIREEREEEVTRLQTAMFSAFEPFLKVDHLELSKTYMREAIEIIAVLKRRWGKERHVFELHMSTNLDALNERHGFPYNATRMIPAEEQFGLLSTSVDMVDFVVTPTLLTYGKWNLWYRLGSLTHPVQVSKPRVLLKNYAERKSSFSKLSSSEQYQSFCEAQGLDPHLDDFFGW